MAGKLPVFGMPSRGGEAGTSGSPGYTGTLGQTSGAALGTGLGASGLGGGAVAGSVQASLGGIPGAVVGAPLGPLGIAAMGVAGAFLGAGLDALVGWGTSTKPKRAKIPKPKPAFSPPSTYQSAPSRLGDPGGGSGMPMSPDVRFSAASNLQKKFS